MDYLDWQSTLSLEQVFGETTSFSHPTILSEKNTVYLSQDKNDNRSVLMLHRLGDDNFENSTQSISPSPYNLQTRVNEYGGKPYWVFESSLIFANRSDQCLYRQKIIQSDLDTISVGPPKRISVKSTEEQCFMYADVHELNYNTYLSLVEFERSDVPHSNNSMFIGAFNSESKNEPVALIEGADFYSNLVVNKTQDKVAWVQWNHPNMPWDDTQLWTADIAFDDQTVVFENAIQIDILGDGHGSGASVCQLLFSNNGRLFFSADVNVPEQVNANKLVSDQLDSKTNDFWNVHAYDFSRKEVLKVTSDACEYGYPHWVYGDHRIIQFTGTELLTVASTPSGDELVVIDQGNLNYRRLFDNDEVDPTQCTYQHLDSDGQGNCVVEKLPFDANPSLIKLHYVIPTHRVESHELIEATSVTFETSDALAISFNTKDGEQAYGFYYEPSNKSQQDLTEDDVLPPLLVMVHGGPTARAYGHFDLQKQFWTSRGFAILDVNHRGSSGYGRRYRDALYGQWGERDTRDIIDGINYLIEQQKVDSGRVCIRGKSAGGYAVLRVLTEYPDMFRVGACYYGIGNLVTLSESTHKFEKHYTDRLIDEVYDSAQANLPSSKFYQRSPINKIDKLNSAMIVFQGGLDRVVPPSVAQEVIEVLVSAGIDHEYVVYANEGHGFKQPDNNIDAWQKELNFYQRVLRG